MAVIKAHCDELGVGFAINNAFAQGGEGALELAQLVVDTIEKNPSKPLKFAYEENDSVETKVEKIAKNLYGAASVTYAAKAKKMIKLINEMGVSHFPICIAKTQYSFSADQNAYGAADGFDFEIRDFVINTGAEMIVAIAGNMLRMPGLPKSPQALRIDMINGEIEGLS